MSLPISTGLMGVMCRRDTPDNWVSTNPILAPCEIGIEVASINMVNGYEVVTFPKDADGEVILNAKFGNGASEWNELPYIVGSRGVPGLPGIEGARLILKLSEDGDFIIGSFDDFATHYEVCEVDSLRGNKGDKGVPGDPGVVPPISDSITLDTSTIIASSRAVFLINKKLDSIELELCIDFEDPDTNNSDKIAAASMLTYQLWNRLKHVEDVIAVDVYATETVAGISYKATQEECILGVTDESRGEAFAFVTPENLIKAVAAIEPPYAGQEVAGVIKLATITDVEATPPTTDKAVTPELLRYWTPIGNAVKPGMLRLLSKCDGSQPDAAVNSLAVLRAIEEQESKEPIEEWFYTTTSMSFVAERDGDYEVYLVGGGFNGAKGGTSPEHMMAGTGGYGGAGCRFLHVIVRVKKDESIDIIVAGAGGNSSFGVHSTVGQSYSVGGAGLTAATGAGARASTGGTNMMVAPHILFISQGGGLGGLSVHGTLQGGPGGGGGSGCQFVNIPNIDIPTKYGGTGGKVSNAGDGGAGGRGWGGGGGGGSGGGTNVGPGGAGAPGIVVYKEIYYI